MLNSVTQRWDKRYALRWIAVLAGYWYLQTSIHLVTINYLGELTSYLGYDGITWKRWLEAGALAFTAFSSFILGLAASWLLLRSNTADLIVVTTMAFWIGGALVAASGESSRTLAHLLLINSVATLAALLACWWKRRLRADLAR